MLRLTLALMLGACAMPPNSAVDAPDPVADVPVDGGTDDAAWDPGRDGGAGLDAHVDDAGRADAGPPPEADRFVRVDGSDVGDCTDMPCRTLAYAGDQMASGETLAIGAGVYPDGIDTGTFPRGTAARWTRVVAEVPGTVTLNGGLALYDDGEFYLEFDGLRFEDPMTKQVAGGHVRLSRCSFVGGPPTGNTVNLAIGTSDFQPGAWNVELVDAIVYGLGGRYDVLVYRAVDVTLTRVVARKDGGWGLGSSTATEYEPEGVVIFYESSRTLCDHCIVLDSLKASHDSAEGLGALIVNTHELDLSDDCVIRSSVVIDSAYSGITFEGHGRVVRARVEDSWSSGNAGNGATHNLGAGGDVTYRNVTVTSNAGDGIANYAATAITLIDVLAARNAGEALRGVSGSSSGAGAPPLDFTGFDEARIRAELCAGVSRGFCATSMTFSEYVTSRAGR